MKRVYDIKEFKLSDEDIGFIIESINCKVDEIRKVVYAKAQDIIINQHSKNIECVIEEYLLLLNTYIKEAIDAFIDLYLNKSNIIEFNYDICQEIYYLNEFDNFIPHYFIPCLFHSSEILIRADEFIVKRTKCHSYTSTSYIRNAIIGALVKRVFGKRDTWYKLNSFLTYFKNNYREYSKTISINENISNIEYYKDCIKMLQITNKNLTKKVNYFKSVIKSRLTDLYNKGIINVELLVQGKMLHDKRERSRIISKRREEIDNIKRNLEAIIFKISRNNKYINEYKRRIHDIKLNLKSLEEK
ncbi:hypothetical protein DLH72_04885 [Candidatus Gracilibacteria bacterium]|nr:MAG: hypothetical protein DLH72_04885 [Candidatus Gracilibacteria bacterium]